MTIFNLDDGNCSLKLILEACIMELFPETYAVSSPQLYYFYFHHTFHQSTTTRYQHILTKCCLSLLWALLFWQYRQLQTFQPSQTFHLERFPEPEIVPSVAGHATCVQGNIPVSASAMNYELKVRLISLKKNCYFLVWKLWSLGLSQEHTNRRDLITFISQLLKQLPTLGLSLRKNDFLIC